MTEVITAPRLPGPERRKQLLDSALRVFARQGYHETSMNAVANEAGVTKPVLYQHFASKREMYSDLLRITADRLADAITQTRLDLGAEDTRSKIEAGYLGFFRFFDGVPDAFSVLYGPSLGHDQELRHVAQRVQEEFAARMATLISEVGHEEAIIMAWGLNGLIEGLIRNWMHEGRRRSAEEMAALATRLAWDGMKSLA
ncbi:MAG: TetR/AcrR family transcriptional regulator [Actinobacteria bacterium]|nr:TetR/AcrR family transcriptional regulator [Actinomycetota bacterium]MBT3746615.1 TetR/AcrR family transcriptional regulator [Actinomycetota bacterium]MBT3969670.1 TetR/AcrR family transcriptional regulator [Actinomycetota bacterium]MBT4302400.1 TetR/AcrR family transcriptional regulator [Actinomycetota bacterium]MBT4476783.1 TetR/AcrR family transcriptional regulator [Actinomycetota bacterium]